MTWGIIVIAMIAALGLALNQLRAPYIGCGLALLGAILAGGLALVAGMAYLKYGSAPPKPRNDSDFSSMAVPLFCLVFIPAGSALTGFVLGIGYAFWRERWLTTRPPRKPERLDL